MENFIEGDRVRVDGRLGVVETQSRLGCVVLFDVGDRGLYHPTECTRIEPDWSKPIEAYHPGGRVVDVTFARVSGGWYYIGGRSEIDGGWVYIFAADGTHSSSHWRIRNRITAMGLDTLLKRIAMDGDSLYQMDAAALLPVDDRIVALARSMCNESPYSLDAPAAVTNGHIYRLVLDAIKRGRDMGDAERAMPDEATVRLIQVVVDEAVRVSFDRMKRSWRRGLDDV